MNSKYTPSRSGEFESLARAVLEDILSRRSISYAELAERLEHCGVAESERSLKSRIESGSFSAAFLLQCMIAIGANELRIIG
jgi:hypothetical protein